MIIAACVREGGRVILKTAKDLTKDEVFELYTRVKEELGAEKGGDDSVLDVNTDSPPIGEESPAPEETPAQESPATETSSPDPMAPETEGSLEGGDEIGDILKNLGLGEDIPGEDPPATDVVAETEREAGMIEAIISSVRPRFSAQGLQMNRKDKDLMSDGIKAPRYEDPKERGKKEDARDPGAVRYKKNKDERDPDIESDKDLK